ncbi:hypothetical protein [Fimbriimonas ginsengisoli]|uniref:Uncharacterized protein n=1 Tax=Fimbriimonas ginsengisoli Gsoil 348 TaxID=661478 RepID=A0A068NWC3_FIMGI|nr:hypothetical protein [Fimbriimonas ginsengisoli]AIE87040.1 hypothetical protein OP10G_3672 [Fimbriimonas ginsengisoli Gsoil 348]
MMIPLLAAVFALAPQGTAANATYTDDYLGLAFNIPPGWSLVRKTKDMTRYSLPIEGSSTPAELEIIRAPFHSSKEIWQTIQLRTNETLHREIVRQWEQDVIQVPILFTQINWSDKGTAKTTLTGLYFTRTPLKMLVRLTSPPADFDKVRYEFQTALETLHTTNGTQPVEDDENIKFDVTKKIQPAPPKAKVIDSGKRNAKLVKPKVAVPLTVSTKSVTLRIPDGWSATDISDGKLTLHHAKLSAPITVEVRSVLDSEKAGTALLKQAAVTLPDFEAGVKRLDTEPKPNAAGCSVSTVWRIGRGKDGDLITFNATGEQSDFYLLASYRITSKAALKGDQNLIKDLFDKIALETVQP